jgi:hypothetical protein
MGLSYRMPELDTNEAVADLVVQSDKAYELTPETVVLCLNRGNRVLHETFNAEHYQIPPGKFRMQYGAAVHCQRRQVVPGTRDIEGHGFRSFIAIYGVDAEADCVPFTDAELQAFGEKVEAIDRSAMANPADRDVTTIPTARARAALGSFGMAGKGKVGIDASAQATPEAEEAAAHVLEPPAESATREAEAEAAAVQGTEPKPRRPR